MVELKFLGAKLVSGRYVSPSWSLLISSIEKNEQKHCGSLHVIGPDIPSGEPISACSAFFYSSTYLVSHLQVSPFPSPNVPCRKQMPCSEMAVCRPSSILPHSYKLQSASIKVTSVSPHLHHLNIGHNLNLDCSAPIHPPPQHPPPLPALGRSPSSSKRRRVPRFPLQ